MDANFRLKSRLHSNSRVDPPLGGGMGYQVEEQGYRDHLVNYITEEDVTILFRNYLFT